MIDENPNQTPEEQSKKGGKCKIYFGVLVVVLAVGVVLYGAQGGLFQGKVFRFESVDFAVKEPIVEKPIVEEQVSMDSEQILDISIADPKVWSDTPIPFIKPLYHAIVGDNDPLIYGNSYTYAEPHDDQRLLAFSIQTLGTYLKQKGKVHLNDFYFQYKFCVGDDNYRPINTPKLLLSGGSGLVEIGVDANKDGIFRRDEILSDYWTALDLQAPSGRGDTSPLSMVDFVVAMDVDSTMCPYDSKARVVLTDIMWKDDAGEKYLYSNDSDLPNVILEDDIVDVDNNSVFFLR